MFQGVDFAEDLACVFKIHLALSEIDDLEHQLWGAKAAPKGLLRVNATLGFGRSQIAPLISEYVRKYPQVEIQLQLSVNPPPITDDAYDLCFRFGLPPDSRAMARFIAPNRRIVVASPGYLKRSGEPKSPADLAKHNCIGIRQGDEAYGLWRFVSTKDRGRSASAQSIKIRRNLTTNDGEIAVNWALAGHGILLRACCVRSTGRLRGRRAPEPEPPRQWPGR